MFDIEDCKVTFLPEDTYEVSFPAGHMLLKYETEPPHGDEICSVYFSESDNELPYWCYLRNIKQISIDKSTESFFISIEAVKPHQWSGVVNLIIDPKHSKYASLDDWYPSITAKENKICFYNSYTEKECILDDFQLLNWQSF